MWHIRFPTCGQRRQCCWGRGRRVFPICGMWPYEHIHNSYMRSRKYIAFTHEQTLRTSQQFPFEILSSTSDFLSFSQFPTHTYSAVWRLYGPLHTWLYISRRNQRSFSMYKAPQSTYTTNPNWQTHSHTLSHTSWHGEKKRQSYRQSENTFYAFNAAWVFPLVHWCLMAFCALFTFEWEFFSLAADDEEKKLCAFGKCAFSSICLVFFTQIGTLSS